MRTLITVTVLLATACGGEKNNATPATPTTPTTRTPAPPASEAGAPPAEKTAPTGQALSSPMCDQFTADELKAQTARRAACWYTCEAWPAWQQLHRGECPKKLSDLTALMHREDAVDPWGRPYEMACGDELPAGAQTECEGQFVPGPPIAVLSRGADGEQGTPDDVKSWE